jgi:type VI secretion system secreted protein Hcp
MKMLEHLAMVSLVAGLAASAPAWSAKTEITLEVEKTTTPVLAWSWGASNSGSVNSGGGGGVGIANFQDMSITRYTDAQSPFFITHMATGEFIKAVTLRPGALEYKLSNVLVTSYSTGGTEGNAAQTENISLSFGKIEFKVGNDTFCFDLKLGTDCQ